MRHGGRGFTLVEMAVVVAIIAVLGVAVVLSVTRSPARALGDEAERLRLLLELATDDSRTTGSAILWTATADGYRFDPSLPRDAERIGPPLLLDARLGPRTLSAGLAVVGVEVEGGRVDPPRIPFVAGTVTPFRILLTAEARRIEITGNAAGTIVIREMSPS